MKHVWTRAAAGRTSIVIGAPIAVATTEGIRPLRVPCDLPRGPLGPLLEARDNARQALGWGQPLLQDAAGRLRAGLRRTLLGEFSSGDAVSEVVATLNQFADASTVSRALVLEPLESADRATLSALVRIIERPGWLRMPLVLGVRTPEPTGPVLRLIAAIERNLGSESVVRISLSSAPPPLPAEAPPAERLEPRVRRVLRAGALAGRAFDARLVAGMLETSELEVLEGLQAAVDAGVHLEDDGQGGFRIAPQLAERLRLELLPSLARAWHRRLAELLDPAPDPDPPAHSIEDRSGSSLNHLPPTPPKVTAPPTPLSPESLWSAVVEAEAKAQARAASFEASMTRGAGTEGAGHDSAEYDSNDLSGDIHAPTDSLENLPDNGLLDPLEGALRAGTLISPPLEDGEPPGDRTDPDATSPIDSMAAVMERVNANAGVDPRSLLSSPPTIAGAAPTVGPGFGDAPFGSVDDLSLTPDEAQPVDSIELSIDGPNSSVERVRESRPAAPSPDERFVTMLGRMSHGRPGNRPRSALGDAARAADHLAAAGDATGATAKLIQAAVDAAALGAAEQGLALIDDALAALDRLPESRTHRGLRARALAEAARIQWTGVGSDSRFTLEAARETAASAAEALNDDDPPALRSDIASLRAHILHDVGGEMALQEALQVLTEASHALERVAAPVEAARLFNDQAAIWVRLGDPVRAHGLMEASRKVFASRAGHDETARAELAETDHLIARLPLHVAARPGRERDAATMGLRHAAQAAQAYAELERPWDQARVWETIGRLELRRGRIDQAIDALQQATRMQQQLGDVLGLASTVEALARALAAAGRPEVAIGLLRDSLALNAEKGSVQGVDYLKRTVDALWQAMSPAHRSALVAEMNHLRVEVDHVAAALQPG